MVGMKPTRSAWVVNHRRIAFGALGAVVVAHTLAAQPAPSARRVSDFAPAQAVVGRNGMVASQESRASRLGVEVLQKGGNAVDAAVAVGFAMAGTYPRARHIRRRGLIGSPPAGPQPG